MKIALTDNAGRSDERLRHMRPLLAPSRIDGLGRAEALIRAVSLAGAQCAFPDKVKDLLESVGFH